jgi:putative DNA primase/helicase
MRGSVILLRFVQKAVGYSLTGDVTEEVLFLLHGTGSNGKTLLLNIILKLMGDYGQSTPVSILRGDEKIGNATPELARLYGVRFAKIVELRESIKLNEERVKAITSTDRIVGRGLYQGKLLEFDPTHKLWIATNHLPKIKDDSYAMWRRLKPIPFNVTFKAPENAQPGDKVRNSDLGTILRAEMSGILNWAIKGCLLWRTERLGDPPAVRNMRTDYQEREDVVGRFLDQETEPCDGQSVRAKTLYDAYRKWSEEDGEQTLSTKEFASRLESRGCIKDKTMHGKFYRNMRLVKPWREVETQQNMTA